MQGNHRPGTAAVTSLGPGAWTSHQGSGERCLGAGGLARGWPRVSHSGLQRTRWAGALQVGAMQKAQHMGGGGRRALGKGRLLV